MKQRIMHGASIDTATPDEVASIFARSQDEQRAIDYYRARGALALNAQGQAQQEIEEVPAGYDWYCERIGLSGPVGATVNLFENDPSGPNLLETLTIPGNGVPGEASLPTDQRSVPIANPAQGAEWSTIVPANTFWRLISGQATLVTSAAVANRELQVQFVGPNGALGTFQSPSSQAASLTGIFTFGRGVTTTARIGTSSTTLAVPDMWLPPGTTIQSVTNLRDVGDQWQNIVLQIEEWVQTNTGEYSDAFSNNLYVPANSSIIAAVTGGTANGQVAYNIQIRRVRRPQ